MTKKEKNSFSDEALEFRKLDKTKKYAKLLQFCKKRKRIPNVTDVPESERVLGQFLINNKSALNRGGLEDWEVDLIAQAMGYAPSKDTRLEKLIRIRDFCVENGKTPTQSSKDLDEKKLGQLLNTVKNSIKKLPLTPEENDVLKVISAYKSRYQKSRKSKLTEVLGFCKEHKRTPRQHVSDLTEKRYAEFLSTTTTLYNKGKLEAECIPILEKISEYSPKNRLIRLKQIADYTAETKTAPKASSLDLVEKQHAAYLAKAKTLMKNGELSPQEEEVLQEALDNCNVKTRLDKLRDVMVFITSTGELPKLDSDDESERKLATFMNNIKQVRKKGKLKMDERQLLADIESMSKPITSAFS